MTIQPLTPADCDLRDFRNMPLDVQRFRDSDLVTEEDPETVIAAIFLWGVAWHQLPAASLPNDDRALARFAGYGRSLAAWHNVRDGALRGFVECSDGRLYHPVLAEKANAAWDKRLKLQWGKAKDRHRKAEKDLAAEDRTAFPEFEEWKDDREVPAHRSPSQPRLPLESTPGSGGKTAPSARDARARDRRAGAPAYTDEGSDPKKGNEYSNRSAGNGGQFPRNGVEIPPENALKEKGKEKGKILGNLESLPDHNSRTRDPVEFPAGDVVELHALVCSAAGYRPTSPGAIAASMDQVREWKNEGLDFEEVVLPAIRAVVSSSTTTDRTRTLGRFRHAIAREQARYLASAKARRRHVPTESPVLEPNGEDPKFRVMRQAILDRVGPARYVTTFNPIRFRFDEPEFGDDRLPLYVDGPDHAQERIVFGDDASIVRNAARTLGFTDVWKGK